MLANSFTCDGGICVPFSECHTAAEQKISGRTAGFSCDRMERNQGADSARLCARPREDIRERHVTECAPNEKDDDSPAPTLSHSASASFPC